MSKSIILHRHAQAEFDDAANWYDLKRPGQGLVFTYAIRATLQKITTHPLAYATVYEDIREALVSGYPYAIYFQENPSQIKIIAIFHTSRDPEVWQQRVK